MALYDQPFAVQCVCPRLHKVNKHESAKPFLLIFPSVDADPLTQRGPLLCHRTGTVVTFQCAFPSPSADYRPLIVHKSTATAPLNYLSVFIPTAGNHEPWPVLLLSGLFLVRDLKVAGSTPGQALQPRRCEYPSVPSLSPMAVPCALGQCRVQGLRGNRCAAWSPPPSACALWRSPVQVLRDTRCAAAPAASAKCNRS